MTNLPISPSQAKAELARRELARRHFIDFNRYVDEGYLENWHNNLVCDALERLERGEIRWLIIEIPPRHGKSLHVSQRFPAWCVGRDANTDIIVASYSGDLATTHGRETRNLIQEKKYANVFKTRLAPDSSAKGNWNTQKQDSRGDWINAKGAYNAVGIGGSTTGKGADFFIIDDAFKDRKEADSKIIRDGAWDWFRSVARTRLTPNGCMTVMMCMTGDTNVLLSNGTEKKIANIKVGDEVATYDNGFLNKSKVLNWSNQGCDFILKITTKNGKIIRANKRHPFLVYRNNKIQWIKLQDLLVGDHMLAVHGKGSNVKQLIAKNQQNVKDFVTPAMVKHDGKLAITRHQERQKNTVEHDLNIGMVFLLKILNVWKKHKMVYVQYVKTRRLKKTPERTGIINYALTTAIKQIKSEGFFAMIATWLLDTVKQKKFYYPQQLTSDFTLDEIVSILPDGYEDVFDLTIENTENFIANGVVSHNTRWHRDDLIGRIVDGKETKEPWVDYFDYIKNGIGDAKWVRLQLKAIADTDEQYRKKGEALWAERYSIAELKDIKRTLGEYEFSALYQANPVDEGSQEFKTDWFQYRTMTDVQNMMVRRFATIDPNLKKSDDSDYCGVVRNYINDKNQWNIKASRYRLDSKEVIDLIFLLHAEGFEKIGVEEGAFSYVIEPFLQDEMKKRGKFPNVIPLKHNQTMKETRIRGLVPWYANRQIFHIDGECDDLEEELLVFPKGSNDDVCDALAYQIQIAEAPVSLQEQLIYAEKQTERVGHVANRLSL